MGRPTPSETVLEFAWTFAQSVTVPSQSICDLVARAGPSSIFSVMCRLSHKVREQTPLPMWGALQERLNSREFRAVMLDGFGPLD